MQQAKAHYYRRSEGPQINSRHDDERAVVLSIADYRALAAQKRDFKAYPLGGPKERNRGKSVTARHRGSPASPKPTPLSFNQIVHILVRLDQGAVGDGDVAGPGCEDAAERGD
jgi:hypothetical protein